MFHCSNSSISKCSAKFNLEYSGSNTDSTVTDMGRDRETRTFSVRGARADPILSKHAALRITSNPDATLTLQGTMSEGSEGYSSSAGWMVDRLNSWLWALWFVFAVQWTSARGAAPVVVAVQWTSARGAAPVQDRLFFDLRPERKMQRQLAKRPR